MAEFRRRSSIDHHWELLLSIIWDKALALHLDSSIILNQAPYIVYNLYMALHTVALQRIDSELLLNVTALLGCYHSSSQQTIMGILWVMNIRIKGIRDAGSTADFRILFEIFEILEKFDFFETFKFLNIIDFFWNF